MKGGIVGLEREGWCFPSPTKTSKRHQNFNKVFFLLRFWSPLTGLVTGHNTTLLLLLRTRVRSSPCVVSLGRAETGVPRGVGVTVPWSCCPWFVRRGRPPLPNLTTSTSSPADLDDRRRGAGGRGRRKARVPRERLHEAVSKCGRGGRSETYPTAHK